MTTNVKVDSFLTACLVLTFALVVGLGLGHFMGERASFSHSFQYFPNLASDISWVREHYFPLIFHRPGYALDEATVKKASVLATSLFASQSMSYRTNDE